MRKAASGHSVCASAAIGLVTARKIEGRRLEEQGVVGRMGIEPLPGGDGTPAGLACYAT